jgi:hypothetical protein
MDRDDFIWGLCTTVFYVNRKIWAKQGAQAAVHAMEIVDDFRGMVPFGVRAVGHYKQMPGAELHAKTASFTSFFDDMNDAARYLDAISIQRLSPINHASSLSINSVASSLILSGGCIRYRGKTRDFSIPGR